MADPLGDSVPLTGDPRIDVVTQGGSWGFGPGPHVLTYSLDLIPGGAAWTTAAQDAVAQALAAWSAVDTVVTPVRPSVVAEQTMTANITRTAEDMPAATSALMALM